MGTNAAQGCAANIEYANGYVARKAKSHFFFSTPRNRMNTASARKQISASLKRCLGKSNRFEFGWRLGMAV